jgi:hypothetical protein
MRRKCLYMNFWAILFIPSKDIYICHHTLLLLHSKNICSRVCNVWPNVTQTVSIQELEKYLGMLQLIPVSFVCCKRKCGRHGKLNFTYVFSISHESNSLRSVTLAGCVACKGILEMLLSSTKWKKRFCCSENEWKQMMAWRGTTRNVTKKKDKTKSMSGNEGNTKMNFDVFFFVWELRLFSGELWDPGIKRQSLIRSLRYFRVTDRDSKCLRIWTFTPHSDAQLIFFSGWILWF